MCCVVGVVGVVGAAVVVVVAVVAVVADVAVAVAAAVAIAIAVAVAVAVAAVVVVVVAAFVFVVVCRRNIKVQQLTCVQCTSQKNVCWLNCFCVKTCGFSLRSGLPSRYQRGKFLGKVRFCY